MDHEINNRSQNQQPGGYWRGCRRLAIGGEGRWRLGDGWRGSPEGGKLYGSLTTYPGGPSLNGWLFWEEFSTKDRLLNWGIVPDGVCVLCGLALGTHYHIFFLCPFSASSWSHFLHVNEVTRSVMDLQAELIWATNHRSSSFFKHSIFKLSLAAVLYGISCERNRRVFQRQSLSSMDLISKQKKEDILATSIQTRSKAHDMIRRMLASLGDPYTRFLSPAEFSKMGRYDMTGIGINLREVPDENGAVKLKVLGLILDGPAHTAGVRQGDEFLAVNGVDVKGKSAFEVSSLLQGPNETFVTVQVKHGNCGPVQSIEVQRQLVARTPVLYRLEQIENGATFVGYVRLKEFNALARKDLLTGNLMDIYK
ncbi:hypothetical protein RHSIM_Rhsim02G0153500 [Rhododendron simsii]|uniref:PDZ domain-containing protein n=1 Tax=Rhododendron simsii TaxID=118357 RepID=A0A834H9D4_RHOSS|nr:hypothetical protein RHSIM_Rhsim02G0153500 [Rhododendron simsii]